MDRQRAALTAAASQLATRPLSEDALQTAAIELLASLHRRPDYCCAAGAGAPSVDAAGRILLARARSRAIDEHRARRRQPVVALEAAGRVALDDDLADQLSASDWRARVEACLPSRHRAGWTAWRLKTEWGLEAPQIAAAMQTTPDAVRQRLTRCAAWIRANVPA